MFYTKPCDLKKISISRHYHIFAGLVLGILVTFIGQTKADYEYKNDRERKAIVYFVPADPSAKIRGVVKLTQVSLITNLQCALSKTSITICLPLDAAII